MEKPKAVVTILTSIRLLRVWDFFPPFFSSRHSFTGRTEKFTPDEDFEPTVHMGSALPLVSQANSSLGHDEASDWNENEFQGI
jgi:hypothetical protein